MSDEDVFVRVPYARWLEILSREDGPVIVSGADVRDPIYVQWPGDLEVVQYQPVPTPAWWLPGTPTGVERRQA